MKNDLTDFAHGAAGRSVAAEVARSERAYLRLLERSIVLAREALAQASIMKSDKQKIVVALMLGRLLAAAQAGALLALRGLEHDAAVEIRVALELLANLKNCAEVPGFLQKYLNAELVRKQKLARGGKSLSGLSKAEVAKYERLEKHWQVQVLKKGAKELKFYDVCVTAKMTDSYNTVYRLASTAVHSAPRLLEDLVITKNGRVDVLDLSPRTAFVPLYLFTLTEFVLLGCAHFAQLAGVNIVKKWNRLHGQLAKKLPPWPT